MSPDALKPLTIDERVIAVIKTAVARARQPVSPFKTVETLITEDSDEQSELMALLMALYMRAAARYRSEDGMHALHALFSEIADWFQVTDRGNAAALIIAFYQFADVEGTDTMFRGIGSDSVDGILQHVANADRNVELIHAVAGVWLEVLPEAHTSDGLARLRAWAKELAEQ
jgi:hypothetical protein